MRTKSIFLLFCVVALIVPLAAVSAQGGAIGTNEVVEGTVSGSQAQYQLALEAGQTVSITLNSDEFDAYLIVQDADGMSLATDDDSGGNLNSALLFSAPIAGTYTVVVGAYGGSATGAYTLTTAEAAVVEITYDSSTKVMFDGTGGVQYFTFMGKQGDAVNLYTDNGELDLRLTLYGPDGTEVAYDDDSGEGMAPLLRRVLLPASGAYQVELAPYSESEAGVAQLILELTELVMLGDGPQTVVFNSEMTTETYGLALTEGASYRVTLTSDVAANGNMEIMLDPVMYDVVSVNFNNLTEVSTVFTSNVTGTVTLTLDNYTWVAEEVTFTVDMVPVE